MEKETFSYSYSAYQQDEINEIRKKYLPPESVKNDKMEELRRLDKSVGNKALAVSLTVGVLSMLLFGFGMCCVLEWTGLFVLGVICGVLGLAGIIGANPIHNRIVKKERERIAPLIIKLSDELTGRQSK